jgi:hypothetical protein
MKKVLLATSMLVLLALLAAPFWIAMRHPELIPTLPVVATPTIARAATSAELLATTVPTGSTAPVSTPTGDYMPVLVTGGHVNLRDQDRNASGLTVSTGQPLTVYWQPDGYGLITSPAAYAGLFIWRGCTSDPAEYGCEAK